MIPLDTKQQRWLPLGLSPQEIATGSSCPDTTFPKLGKVYAAEHRFRPLQPLFDSKQFCGKQVSCLDGRSSLRKRYIVFDQSGNQTRLLQCGFPSPVVVEQGKILGSLNPVNGLSKGHAIPGKILVGDEKCCNEEEESEMHENTEEIDALLYSEDDYESDDDDDDEVMSTGHSPFLVDQQACNETTENELDDGPRRKRQKLLDHSSPSFVFATESNISSKQETGSGLSQDDEEQSRRRTDKIKTALRILESVVPGGVKGKEALLLIDEAIDYLKLLKQNLNSLTS